MTRASINRDEQVCLRCVVCLCLALYLETQDLKMGRQTLSSQRQLVSTPQAEALHIQCRRGCTCRSVSLRGGVDWGHWDMGSFSGCSGGKMKERGPEDEVQADPLQGQDRTLIASHPRRKWFWGDGLSSFHPLGCP